MNRSVIRPSFVYLAALAVVSPFYLLAGDGVQLVLFYACGLSSVVAVLIGVHLHHPEHRGPWLAFAGALLLFVLGDMAFDVYALNDGVAPVPSIADVLYLASYPVLAFGVVLLVRHRVPGRDLVSAVDAAIVTIAVGAAAWALVVSPFAANEELGLATRLVAIAYPMFDLLVLAVVVRLLLSGGRRSVAYSLVAASVSVLLITDGFYTVATMHDTYRDGSVIEMGWMLSYVLFGAAALHPSMHVVSTWSSSRRPNMGAVLAILAVAALSPIALLIFEHVYRGDDNVFAIAVCSAMIVVLVFARIGVLTHALDRAFRVVTRADSRRLALTNAALAMVTADGTQTIADAAVRAAVASAGPGAWALFVACDPEGARIAARAGTSAPVAIDAAIEALLDRDELLTRPIRVLDADEHADGYVRLVAPVTVAMMLRAVVVVGNVGVDVDELMPTVALLTSEVALALHALDSAEVRRRTRTEQSFGAVIKQSSDVITIAGADGVIRYQGPSIEHILDVPFETFVGRPFTEFVHPEDVDTAQSEIARILDAPPGSTGRFDARVRHGDGSWRDTDTIVTNLVGTEDVDSIVLNSRDVTERRALERQLEEHTLYDALTGLPNRALFIDRVEHALARAGRLGSTVAVLFADLDDFQAVNDSHGCPAGDQVLKIVAQRLLQSVRAGDTVARLGGDEFAILLEPGDTVAIAEVVARRVAADLRSPIELSGGTASIHASIGIAFGMTGEHAADELLRNADLAMYMAKRDGKDRYELFSPSMHEKAVQRRSIAADLADAVARDELVVFYQPIVDIRTGALAGAEAMVRWNHPRRGLVGPEEFMPVAGATGLVVPFDRFVLDQACRQAQSWRTQGIVDDSFFVGVSLSGRQLQDPSIVGDVERALHSSGLPAAALVLEVTESAVMGNLDVALARLRALKALGLRLAVDEFGTSYSSLRYVGELPVDLIKIDKSFVDQLLDEPDGTALVRDILDVGRTYGLTVIAEGVENDAQLDLLEQLHCHKSQGSLLAEPMPAAAMTHVLESERDGHPLHGPTPRLTVTHR